VPGERPGAEGGARHANRLARTRALCEAGLRCFLARGLDAVTIDDVVREAGTAKGTFYRYFEDKDDLVAAVFRPIADTVVAAMERCIASVREATDATGLEAAYAALAGDLLLVLVEQPDALRLFLQERHGPRTPARAAILDLDDAVVDRAVGMTEAAASSGLLAPGNPRVTALAVVGAVHELLWRQFQGRGTPELLVDAGQLIELVLYGIRSRR
jgi:AcrR family transcriptional regulator